MQIPVYLHNALDAHPAGSRAIAGREAALVALAEDLPLAAPPHDECRRVSVYLDAATFGQLQLRAAELGLGLNELISRASYAWARRQAHGARPAATSRSDTDRMRETIVDALDSGISSGRLVLAEGSTGIGKSRILCLAASRAVARGENVLMTAPTVADISRLMDTWAELGSTIRTGVVLGRAQFVDVGVLGALLDDPDTELPGEEREAVRGWIASLGKTPIESSAARAVRASMLEDVGWLAAELELISPSLDPIPVLREDSDPEDLGYQAYLRARMLAGEESHQPALIFATHAMVAIDAYLRRMGRNALLPRRDVLLVDEAHLLEENFANAAGTSLSIFGLQCTLQRHLSKLKKPSQKVARGIIKMGQAFQDQSIALCAKSAYVRSGQGHGDGRELSDLTFSYLLRLADSIKGMAEDPHPVAANLQHLRNTIRNNLSGDFAINVSFSPKVRRPTINLGPSSVHKLLGELWGRVRGAGLVSASLFIDGAQLDGYGFMKAILSLPPARTMSVRPQRAAWVTSTPVLHLPGKVDAQHLICPQQDAVADEISAYHSEVAGRLRAIATTAAGGVLVLFTSFRNLEAAAGRLLTLGDRLIVQDGNHSFAQCERDFRRKANPVWLATGSAWAGLNLVDSRFSDADAGMDMLLTDVVVVCLPFRSGTTTAAARNAHRFQNVGVEAALRLKQALGRLVRREGLQRRRLHIFDGRLSSEHQGHLQLTRACAAVLREYKTAPLLPSE